MVVIALSRMHYLVRRWRLGYRIGSNAVLSRGISESTLSSTLSLYHGELQMLIAPYCSVSSFKTFVAGRHFLFLWPSQCSVTVCGKKLSLGS
jgi:hypothetical protein